MTSWIIYFFRDPKTGLVRHFTSSGAAIIAAKLAHQEWDGTGALHVRKRQSVNLTQKSLAAILNGEGWDNPERPSKLVYTVGVGGGHDVQWYDMEKSNAPR